MPLRLTRLQISDHITDPKASPPVTPTQQFLRYFNKALEQIEAGINGLAQAIVDITAAQAAADEANTALENGAILVKDEGGAGAETHTVNFVGAGVSAAVAAGVATVTVSGLATFSGALVKKAADQTAANYSAGVEITWDSETGGYDTDAYHDNVTNNTRLTIPTDGKYILRFGIEIGGTTLTASDYARATIKKNGSFTWVGRPGFITEISAAPAILLSATSAAVDCVAGDYFEVWLDTEADTSITIEEETSWFAVQLVA